MATKIKEIEHKGRGKLFLYNDNDLNSKGCRRATKIINGGMRMRETTGII